MFELIKYKLAKRKVKHNYSSIGPSTFCNKYYGSVIDCFESMKRIKTGMFDVVTQTFNLFDDDVYHRYSYSKEELKSYLKIQQVNYDSFKFRIEQCFKRYEIDKNIYLKCCPQYKKETFILDFYKNVYEENYKYFHYTYILKMGKVEYMKKQLNKDFQ